MTRPQKPGAAGHSTSGTSTRDKLTKAIASGGRTASAAPETRRRRTPLSPTPEDARTDTRPAMTRRSLNKQQQGINFDTALLEYMREVQAYMARRHPEEAGSESLASLIDQAVREKITRWERKYAEGDAIEPL